MPSSCYTDAVCDVDTLAARRYVEGRGDTVVHLRRVPPFRMGPSIKRKFAPGECPYSWPVTSHINLPSAALCDARSLKTTERMLQQWHVQIIDSVTMRQHCFFGRADKAFEAHRCCPGSVSHHGCEPVTCLQSAVTNASESRLYPSSHAHASCPEASGVLGNNSRGKGHVMKRRWHVEALGSSGDKVSTPGVEPGSSRPRRDVLTTRRCGPCVSCIFCVIFVLLCEMLWCT